jgi:hypothetical protein
MSRIGTIAANLIGLNMALTSSGERSVKEHGKLKMDHWPLPDGAYVHAQIAWVGYEPTGHAHASTPRYKVETRGVPSTSEKVPAGTT